MDILRRTLECWPEASLATFIGGLAVGGVGLYEQVVSEAPANWVPIAFGAGIAAQLLGGAGVVASFFIDMRNRSDNS